MKLYILSFLFLTGAILGASAQEKENKETECQAFKNGHFIIKENLLSKTYTIKRQGDKQIETDPDGTVFVFDVNWIDDCTYSLKLDTIAKNPNSLDWKEGQIITVKILNTNKKGYIQESSSNLDELTFVKSMMKINKKAYKKKVQGLIGNELSLNQ